jgi:hypothetical protein
MPVFPPGKNCYRWRLHAREHARHGKRLPGDHPLFFFRLPEAGFAFPNWSDANKNGCAGFPGVSARIKRAIGSEAASSAGGSSFLRHRPVETERRHCRDWTFILISSKKD